MTVYPYTYFISYSYSNGKNRHGNGFFTNDMSRKIKSYNNLIFIKESIENNGEHDFGNVVILNYKILNWSFKKYIIQKIFILKDFIIFVWSRLHLCGVNY